MAKQQEERVNLAALDAQQLANAKQRIESDIQRFAESLGFFNKSAQIYFGANAAIKELTESKEGQPLLLPLTQSLYVSGEVASVDSVLVDVGTGYFVEMSAEEGQDFCKRKVHKLQETMAGLQEVIRTKQNQLLQVQKVLAQKVAEQQPAAAP